MRERLIPGEVVHGDGPVVINVGRDEVTLAVVNTGDRPVQVGSHYHFAEANPALSFDRGAAWGRRLAVPAGTAVRFEPGLPREVALVALGGARVVPGLRVSPAGTWTGARRERAGRAGDAVSPELSRARYAALYGPTAGDRVRLADTNLWIEVTEDRSGGPLAGDEAVFGGGKVTPHRGRGRRARAGHHHRRRPAERPAVVDEPHAAAHRQHPRRAPSTC